MLTVIAIFILAILGMPILGLYLLTNKAQTTNRGLGLAVLAVGIIIWMIMFN